MSQLLKPDPYWWKWVGNEIDPMALDEEIITFLSERLAQLETGWAPVGHVDPPEPREETVTVLPEVQTVTVHRPLVFYLGPNHYPAGLYLPMGYDLETREGTDGWELFRARDSMNGQILTIWAVGPEAADARTEDELLNSSP